MMCQLHIIPELWVAVVTIDDSRLRNRTERKAKEKHTRDTEKASHKKGHKCEVPFPGGTPPSPTTDPETQAQPIGLHVLPWL